MDSITLIAATPCCHAHIATIITTTSPPPPHHHHTTQPRTSSALSTRSHTRSTASCPSYALEGEKQPPGQSWSCWWDGWVGVWVCGWCNRVRLWMGVWVESKRCFFYQNGVFLAETKMQKTNRAQPQTHPMRSHRHTNARPTWPSTRLPLLARLVRGASTGSTPPWLAGLSSSTPRALRQNAVLGCPSKYTCVRPSSYDHVTAMWCHLSSTLCVGGCGGCGGGLGGGGCVLSVFKSSSFYSFIIHVFVCFTCFIDSFYGWYYFL